MQVSAESASNYYQGILITEDDEKAYLEQDLQKYGIENQLGLIEKVIQCESGFQIDPKHNNPCRGIAQFQTFTWKYVNDKGWCSGDIMNPQSQLNCMAILWKMGYQNWWQCYGMVAK